MTVASLTPALYLVRLLLLPPSETLWRMGFVGLNFVSSTTFKFQEHSRGQASPGISGASRPVSEIQNFSGS